MSLLKLIVVSSAGLSYQLCHSIGVNMDVSYCGGFAGRFKLGWPSTAQFSCDVESTDGQLILEDSSCLIISPVYSSLCP